MKQRGIHLQRVFFWPFLIWSFMGAEPARAALSLNEWLGKTEATSLSHLLANISAPGTAQGSVVASPSKDNPNYFYHWVRDAAITMGALVQRYARTSDTAEKEALSNALMDYIRFSRRNQMTENPSGGLGEPKFEVDGSPFYGAWGRPQNDGPALRAITLTKLAFLWLAEGKENLVREYLYEQELPAHRVIKADLEYVSHHWHSTDFDLWEEIRGHHFFTRMVQRRALKDGARLAAFLGDQGAASWYNAQAKFLEAEILMHWDSNRKFLVATLDRDGGIDYKGGLDASIVLGVLHGNTQDGFLSASDSRVVATVQKLEDTFQQIYPINRNGLPALIIGRYPEDRYDGVQTGAEGNGWVLLTAALAEYYYQAATLSRSQTRALSLRAKGDTYLDRIRYHGGSGDFAEQMNRYSGYMQGAPHLTWSYGAFLTAYWARPTTR